MAVFVDTSGILAASDRDDKHHELAVEAFSKAVEQRLRLATHSMVITECSALMHRRLGHRVALAFLDSLSRFDVYWLDQELFADALARFRLGSPKGLSLVDCASFELMNLLSLRTYIGIDRHFEREGFQPLV
jgi:uncharacterized protein